MVLYEQLGVGLIVAGGVVILAQQAFMAAKASRARRPVTPHGNPPPKVVHAVLPPAATRFKRVILLGDIHGCPVELQALLDKVGYRKGVDLLLSVGDLVNKGPDSEKVLKMALENGILAVRGNHDDAAYEAFRAWLDGRDMPKPAKHHWVPGLAAELAELLAQLPFTLQLPAYGVLLVHAGLLPGLPLELQSWMDLQKMRDVVPAAQAQQADAAAATTAPAAEASADVDAMPTASAGNAFDWEAAGRLLAAAAAAGPAAMAAGSNGSGDGQAADASDSTASRGSSAAEKEIAVPAASILPPQLRLVASERPEPSGRAWAAVWQGPLHVFFGHDAKRRLQQQPAATGLDTGCVYGGSLTAAVLPPLDENGRPLMHRLNLPPDAKEFRLHSGLPAFLVSVPAIEEHHDKQANAEEQAEAQREEAAAQRAQHAQQGRAVELAAVGDRKSVV